MSALARPSMLAALFSFGALLLHPALAAADWPPGRELALVAVLLLALVGLLGRAIAARGGTRTGAWLVMAGAALVVAGIGLDGIRGSDGTLTLGLGQTSGNFDEAGPDGGSLGLRPFGFQVGADARTAAGVSLRLPLGTVELTDRRAIAVGGFRLAAPSFAATGEVARLRVATSDGTRTEVAELTPDGPTRSGDLSLSLEQYFPDFALDENQRPFTRSLEPRNPAALLRVARGKDVYRAFVLQSMPGVHRVAPLGITFSLLDVQPQERVTIAVHRRPFALAVLVGGLLLLAGVAIGLSALSASTSAGANGGVAANGGPLVAGAGLLVYLVLVDSGRVLALRPGLAGPGGRLPLPGAGVPLALALIAALAGVLLLAAQHATGVDVAGVARGALVVSVLAGFAGVAVALVRVLPGGGGIRAALPVIGIGCAALVVAATLLWPVASGGPLVAAIVTGLLVANAILIGVGSTAAYGAYSEGATAAASATVLLGLAACETTGFTALRRLLLLVGFLALFVRPY